MKRVISIILVLCLLIPVGAISVFADDGSSWELTEFVDDFGDPTGEAYLRSIVSGTFSNTATPEENMRVILAYSPDRAVFTFRLVEYNDTLKIKATYTDSDSKTIKVKIDDEITEGTLTGTAPNGDLLLTGGLCLIKIYDAFLNGQDVRFIVEIGSSKYSFSADGKGFSDCLDEYWAQNPEKSNGLCYPGTEFIKLDYFIEGDNLKLSYPSEDGNAIIYVLSSNDYMLALDEVYTEYLKHFNWLWGTSTSLSKSFVPGAVHTYFLDQASIMYVMGISGSDSHIDVTVTLDDERLDGITEGIDSLSEDFMTQGVDGDYYSDTGLRTFDSFTHKPTVWNSQDGVRYGYNCGTEEECDADIALYRSYLEEELGLTNTSDNDYSYIYEYNDITIKVMKIKQNEYYAGSITLTRAQ